VPKHNKSPHRSVDIWECDVTAGTLCPMARRYYFFALKLQLVATVSNNEYRKEATAIWRIVLRRIQDMLLRML
jgi:hypothetical protein